MTTAITTATDAAGPEAGLTRRQLLGTAAAVGASAVTPRSATAADLPQRGEFIVRNAHVLTMDASLGDLARGDVHVRDGTIVAVGSDLPAPTARTIDGRGMIALPGLIDTHNHLWNATCRSIVMEGPQQGYFPTVLALGKEYTPDDTYHGVRLACAELIHSGVTTVHDWAHNIRSPAHADADVRALIDCGIRGRFSYGTFQGGPAPDDSMDIADLQRMHRDWSAFANEGLLSLGMASRSVSTSPRGAVSMQAILRDWAAARALKLPITLHTGGPGILEVLEREGLLGSDVQFINTSNWNDADRARIVKAGARVSITPHSEMRYSYALPQAVELLKLGVKISLAMDTAPVAGSADMFQAMRLMMDTQFVHTRDPMSITARQVLEMATINGAIDLGIADRTGSLTPGKRADVILVRTTDLNMAPLGEPVTAIARSAQPSNVDTVVVDGRVLKQAGRLAALDPGEIVANATASLAALKRRANWA